MCGVIISGFVLIDKPVGITSFRALNEIKKKFGTKRVGHAGTLDQAASGLIVAAVGKATRLLPFVETQDKVYSFNLHLGILTDTLEPNGNILAIDENSARSLEQLNAVLKEFLGETEQVPPIYSAIKINGKRASDLALKGKTVELKSRKIFIKELYCTSENCEKNCEPTSVYSVYCHCSKGTYVRSLARDIAEKLGTYGVAGNIRRTSIGNISVENAGDNLILPNELLNWKTLIVNEEEEKKILQGITTQFTPVPLIPADMPASAADVPSAPAELLFVKNKTDKIIAVVEYQNGYLLPKFQL